MDRRPDLDRRSVGRRRRSRRSGARVASLAILAIGLVAVSVAAVLLLRSSSSQVAGAVAEPASETMTAAMSGAGADSAEAGTAVADPGGAVGAEPASAVEPVTEPEPSPAIRKPPIVSWPIDYPASRVQQMSEYSLRHYGEASAALDPSMIVLHYTAGGDAEGAWATFNGNAPNRDELPGTCTHFVIDKDGTIFQLVPLDLRCRHAIGVNDQAIGIEMVQEAGESPAWADRQILDRPAQINAAIALVRWLQDRYGIPLRRVVGHAMVNDVPSFKDLQGWVNDHGDWQEADVEEFRRRVRAAD